MQKIRLLHHFALEIFDLKILLFDWPRTFWPHLRNQSFRRIWHLFKHTAININFHYSPNWEKIKELRKKHKFSHIIKGPLGLPYFPNFGWKTLFSKNLALSCTTPHGTLTSCWAPEKTQEPIQGKRPNRSMESLI